jgi:hypothetical protein
MVHSVSTSCGCAVATLMREDVISARIGQPANTPPEHLNVGVWFRRGRLGMVSPDSQATACPPSGRNSTYRPVQISGTGSFRAY